MVNPLASIIIPCTRPALAERTIESVLNQNYPPSKIEIIVVGKIDSKIRKKFKIKKIEGKFYPGEARNLGAKRAKGDYLLFIDDDCEADENWVKSNLAALKDRKIGVVGGMVIGKSNKLLARCTDFSNFDLCQTKKKSERVVCSATMGIRKEIFQEIGGFDSNLKVGEDIDLCYNLIGAGYKTIYEPKIKVIHDHRKDNLTKLLGYMYFGGRESGFLISKRYPHLDRNAKIFFKLKNPYLFTLIILPFSLFMTLKSIKVNFQEHKKVLVYAPFIFLAKLSYNLGILAWLFEEQKK